MNSYEWPIRENWEMDNWDGSNGGYVWRKAYDVLVIDSFILTGIFNIKVLSKIYS